MQHSDQSVMSVQLALCLRHLPEIIGWGLLPALLALALLRVRQQWLRKCLLGSASALLIVLLCSLVLAFCGWSPTLTGLDRWGVIIAYLIPLLLTVGFTLAAIVLVPFAGFRSLWRPASVGALSFFTAYLFYPLSVGAYCDYANSHRTDTWRWVHAEDCIYLLDKTQGTDSGFAGLIEVYPPYFSLPHF